MRVCAVLFLSLMLLGVASAKIFRKCELAKILERTYRIPRNDVKRFVCIAQYESSFNTAAVGRPNRNGSRDYGLFQINNKYWCQGSVRGHNICKVSCSTLLEDNITPAVNCARLIARQQGFSAWVAYNNRCKNINLDAYMRECWG